VGDYAVYSVAFSPDGALMASAGSDGRIKLWKVQGTTLVPEGRVITVMAQARVAFSPDGKQLAAGGDQGDLFIYDLATSTKSVLLGHADRIRGVAYNGDGNRLVTVDRAGVVKSWNVATRAATTTLTLYAGMSAPYSLSIVRRNAGTALWAAVGLTKPSAPVVGDGGTLPGDAAYVWFGDLNNPAQFTLLNADPEEVDATAISPDDRLLLAGGQGGVAGVWNIQNPAAPTKTGMVPAALNTSSQEIPLTALSFGADGHWLAAAYGGPFFGGSLRIIDATNWQANGLANSTYYGVSAVLRPQGNIFVAGEFSCGLLTVCAD
jgi:WD40 repeat protein